MSRSWQTCPRREPKPSRRFPRPRFRSQRVRHHCSQIFSETDVLGPCRRRPLRCPHDYQPEHGCHLSQSEGLGKIENSVFKTRPKNTGKAERQPTEAGDDQPDAEKARQEARSVHEQPEWDEPHAPEDSVGQVKLVMQVQGKQGESLALRLVER